MNTLPLTLSGADAALISRLLETRYDILCQYLEHEEDVWKGDVQGRADELQAAMKRQARWAAVPTHFHQRMVRNVAEARRMWSRSGMTVETVAHHVAQTVPMEFVPLVLEEAYNGEPEGPDLPASEGWTPHPTFPGDAQVDEPASSMPRIQLDELAMDPDVAAERLEDGVTALVEPVAVPEVTLTSAPLPPAA
ncbi:MAG: hypothetical protein AAF170_08445 [Bacteroidota bacterium]